MRERSKFAQLLSDIRWRCIPIPYKEYLGRRDPKRLAQKLFRKYFKRDINFTSPSTYNEIINVLKLTSDTTMWSKLADKHLVKEYIESKGLGDIVIKTYGAWERVGDVDFDSLPSSFILKPNNGAGKVVIVEDKSRLNRCLTRMKMRKWMSNSYGYRNAETHYAKITPMIIAEQLLSPSEYDKSISTSIIDYKWFCFNGSATYVEVISNRWDEPHYNIYDREWNDHPEYVKGEKSPKPIPQPKQLDRMLEICKSLSEGIPQVRVDLYEVDGKVYFGEMTFTTASGYSRKKSRTFDELLAKEYYANLPK